MLFACLGLGRFTLGMLPAMGADLDLSYSQMGFISTGNFVGYMAAVAMAGFIGERLGARITITLAYGLVAGHLPVIWLYISIGLFGIAVWNMPTIMAAAMGDYLGPTQAAKAFGFITLFFGIVQIVGPTLARYLADITNTFRISFGMCAVATLIAVFLTFYLPRPRS